MGVKIEVTREEVIKPASPTPHHLQTLQLSCVDDAMVPAYVAPIFFYKAENHTITQEVVSLRLKKSLSETLTRFYPLAGRIEGISVNCSDEGASFAEARADCLLSDFLRNPDLESLEQLLPSDFAMFGKPPETRPLLHVKVSFFSCGGVAIAVCVSHQICDATSLATFVRGWAATTRGHVEAAISLEFTTSSFLPPAENPSTRITAPVDKRLDNIERKCVRKRFVFDASNISRLKSKASSERVPNPTRVEVITSLIWKCAAKASPMRLSGMGQAMDLRRWISSTQLKQNTMGNLIVCILLREGDENEMEIREIVTKLRRAKEDVRDRINNESLQDKTLGETIATMLRNYGVARKAVKTLYGITSWCRMGFYEVDFGWGTPVWVAPHVMFQNKGFTTMTLTDTKDGEGIEAWVQLLEQDMSVFERDAELLAFATPNPPVLIS